MTDADRAPFALALDTLADVFAHELTERLQAAYFAALESGEPIVICSLFIFRVFATSL